MVTLGGFCLTTLSNGMNTKGDFRNVDNKWEDTVSKCSAS